MALLMSFTPSVNHWSCTTALQLPNSKHLHYMVTSVSPLWTNALGIKGKRCFEHTVVRIYTSLFHILLLDTLLSSYSLPCFPYGNGERGGPVLDPELCRALARRSNEQTSEEYLPLHWLGRHSWEPVLIKLKLIFMNSSLSPLQNCWLSWRGLSTCPISFDLDSGVTRMPTLYVCMKWKRKSESY